MITLKKKSNLFVFFNEQRILWPFPIDKETTETEGFWPKISLVTPSFNQAQFIEGTIMSVLGQGYPNLEYIIIDGGSTDGSANIIKKYEKYLKFWISEPDSGQTSAINKGFKIASGEIISWVNSDDLLLPFTLWKVGFFFKYFDIKACSGNEVCIDVRSQISAYKRLLPLNTKWLLSTGVFSQPTIFWRRELFNEIGYLDENLLYAMDLDYFLKISSVTEICHVDDYLAAFRYHKAQKTANKKPTESNETLIVSRPYIEKLFRNHGEFRMYYNFCRLKQMCWYFRTGQFRMMVHPLKRFLKQNWPN